MAKRFRDAPIRTTVMDPQGRADWLRAKRYGQIGYVEPKEKPEPRSEQYVPLKRGPKTPLAWRMEDHGPLPPGRQKSRAGRLNFQKQISKPRKVRGSAVQGEHPRAGQRRWTTAGDSKASIEPQSAPTAPLPPVLSVPVPAERVRPSDVTYAVRDGQQEFRKAIIDAYGRCAVTGCQIEDVLDAAHIIPYVDGRSNIVSNGLCLRTDIHRLYDRNLIRIGADGVVVVDAAVVCPDYRALHGRALIPPVDPQSAPCRTLLNERHKYV